MSRPTSRIPDEEVPSPGPRSNRNSDSHRQSGGSSSNRHSGGFIGEQSSGFGHRTRTSGGSSSHRDSGGFRAQPEHIKDFSGVLTWNILTSNVPAVLSPDDAALIPCIHLAFHTDELKNVRTHEQLYTMVRQYTPLMKNATNLGNLYRALLFIHFHGRIRNGLPSGYLQLLDTTDVMGLESTNLPGRHLGFTRNWRGGIYGRYGEGIELAPPLPGQPTHFRWPSLLALYGHCQSEHDESNIDFNDGIVGDDCVQCSQNSSGPLSCCFPFTMKQFGSSVAVEVGNGGCSNCVFANVKCSWEGVRPGVNPGGAVPAGRRYTQQVTSFMLHGN